ncbi:MAG: hydrogenase [Candidatus Omnitrophica bacterium CG11_big_fil_rev_8_21_14_0_20_63_9]|nr:MAG: hydrogenase [Candidatus Omnitrophica bacterium CG11_big_fil_rev_8_21_14_0_20_63_9]
MLTTFIPLGVTLVAAPLVPGLINKTKAAFAGRQGPPLFQLYFDLLKLLNKGAVYSRVTTWIFRAGPIVSLASVIVAALFVPVAGTASLSFSGDIIAFAYLLGLGRFFTVLAALDTGSSFEGMGASREVTFAMFAEPTLFIIFVILARVTGSLSLSSMLTQAPLVGTPSMAGLLALVVFSLFIVCLAENSRIPVDDPATHLELTMIHEVMVLDHGGPDLAFILYGASIKLFVMVAMLAHLVFPMPDGSPVQSGLVFGSLMALITIVIGIVESAMARLRMVRVPRLLMAACMIACFGMIISLR